MNYVEIKTINETMKLSCMILGTHHFGRNGSTYEEAERLLNCFFENGGNIIDTARCPEYNRSEEYIGKYFETRPEMRKKVRICTKWGNPIINKEYTGVERYRYSEYDFHEDLEESLEHLKTDIDIYLIHKDAPNLEPEKIIELMNEPIRAGKVKHIGVSNWRVDRIKQANDYAEKHGLQKFEFSEISYSLYVGGTDGWGQVELVHAAEDWELEVYKTLGINVFAFTSQGYGYFYKNFNKPISEVENCPENIERLKRVKTLCERKGMTPQQIVLGFFMGQEFTVIPIATTTNTDHMLDTMNAAGTVLTADEVRYLLGKSELAI